ncbi:photosystem I assembly protein Ycf3 [Novipirellula artificiosorum]|uniref:Photosystem I assembly protein Ycf3 n=1 Tax=Novipirellula artificiosorum TaxID=2528016 RepID=A0A5C6DVX3_9BACT|nr:photosystem I assembly protein Ycf3 [Novipirellula artificiosorum]
MEKANWFAEAFFDKWLDSNEESTVIRSIPTIGTIRSFRTTARFDVSEILLSLERCTDGIPSGDLLVKRSTKTRRALFLSILAGSTITFSTGCSSSGFSLASMNPFSRPPLTAEPETPANPSVTESIASTTNSATKSIGAVGVSAKNAIGKTTSAVAGVFRRDTDDGADEFSQTDPLTLTDEPVEVSPEVFVANGQLWESTGNFPKAMESYTKALEKKPNDAAALTSVARLHFQQGNHAKAVEYFQRAVKETPTDAALYNDLGLTLSKTGDHAQASQMLGKALELAPGTSRYANNLASVRFEAGDKQGALSVLQQNNKPAVAHFNMAYLHYSQGQMADSRNHLTEAMKYETQASSDAAVRRAVDRAREMLTQIDASGKGVSDIAQAPTSVPAAAASAPNRYAAVPATSVTTAAARQSTSQTPAETASYRPDSTPWAPAMASITQPSSAPAAGSCEGGSCSAPATATMQPAASSPTVTVAGTPNWGSGSWSTTAKPATTGPTVPTQPTAPAAATTPVQPAGAAAPANAYGLPQGLTMPGM